MQRSLSEAEAAASEAVPLERQSREQIEEHFKASRLLPQVLGSSASRAGMQS
jgi:hypothetical protein